MDRIAARRRSERAPSASGESGAQSSWQSVGPPRLEARAAQSGGSPVGAALARRFFSKTSRQEADEEEPVEKQTSDVKGTSSGASSNASRRNESQASAYKPSGSRHGTGQRHKGAAQGGSTLDAADAASFSSHTSEGVHSPAPAVSFSFGQDRLLSRIPSLPEGHDDMGYKKTQGSRGGMDPEWGMLIDAVVAATTRAARCAVREQFAELWPSLLHATSAAKGPPECQHAEPSCQSASSPPPASGFGDSEAFEARAASHGMLAVRSLEAHVADTILEQFGLSECPERPGSPSVRCGWGGGLPPHPEFRASTIDSNTARKISTLTSRSASFQPPGVLESDGDDADTSRTLGDTELESRQGMSDEREQQWSRATSRKVTPRTRRAMMRTRSEMLHERASQLTDGIISPEVTYLRSNSSSPARPRSTFPTLFRFCGFAQWSARHSWLSTWYQLGLLAVSLLIVSGFSYDALFSPIGSLQALPHGRVAAEGIRWHQRGLLSIVPLSLGVVAYLSLSSLLPRSMNIGRTIFLLQMYMRTRDLLVTWTNQASIDAYLTLAVWLLTIAVSCISLLLKYSFSIPDHEDILQMIGFVTIGSLVAAWTQCSLYMCRALSAMVDRFCCGMTDLPDILLAMQEWNVLQAVLLKASVSMEISFIAMLIAISFTVPLLMVDFLSLGARVEVVPCVVPICLVTVLLVRVFFVAAGISDKCARVPALVNSLSFGAGTERRQLRIEYIVRSDAGFHIRDVRLTNAMAVKFLYTHVVCHCLRPRHEIDHRCAP